MDKSSTAFAAMPVPDGRTVTATSKSELLEASALFAKERREHWKDWSTIAAIMIAGLWAISTFVFEQQIKPRFEKPTIRTTVTIELPALESSRFRLPAFPVMAKVQLENTGRRTVKILSGQLELYADTLLESSESDFTPGNVEATLETGRRSRSLFWNKRESRLVFSGSAFKDWTFEAGEKQEFNRLMWLPLNKFDQLEANIYVSATTSDDENVCLKHVVDEKSQTDVIAGHLERDLCVGFPESSAEAKEISKTLYRFNSTAFLALPFFAPAAAGAASQADKH